jgi:hypothetical protein
MRKLIIPSMLIASLMTACNSEKKDSAADSSKIDTTVVDSSATPKDTAAANKAWAEYMTPSEPHKMMATANGKWEAEISFYMNPDSPSISKTVCENKMILGGRYQQSTFTGMMMGMPFEGIATTAYDNARKIYVSTWIDNMGTGLMYMEGIYDDAAKMLTSKGKSIDPVTKKEVLFRETIKFIDDKHQEMEMFDTKDGKEIRTMSIKLTKAK